MPPKSTHLHLKFLKNLIRWIWLKNTSWQLAPCGVFHLTEGNTLFGRFISWDSFILQKKAATQIVKHTWAYNTNIFWVPTRSDSPSRITTLDESALVSTTVDPVQPHPSNTGTKTLINLPHACETKLIADDSRICFCPGVITNCAPFSSVKHFHTTLPLGAAASESDISFRCSSLYNKQNWQVRQKWFVFSHRKLFFTASIVSFSKGNLKKYWTVIRDPGE